MENHRPDKGLHSAPEHVPNPVARESGEILNRVAAQGYGSGVCRFRDTPVLIPPPNVHLTHEVKHPTYLEMPLGNEERAITEPPAIAA